MNITYEEKRTATEILNSILDSSEKCYFCRENGRRCEMAQSDGACKLVACIKKLGGSDGNEQE